MEIWKSRAPATCKFFSWLAAQKRCWTADRLQRRLLPHPAACPFCDQEPKTIDHLLLGCVLARQIWSVIMGNWGKPHWTPEPEAELVRWWTSLNIEKTKRKETWTVITLVAWTLWKHRNDIVFNGASPSVSTILRQIEAEGQNWRAAALLREARSLPTRLDRLSGSE
ncbi:uncharacterized protein [Aegilops tauschii subsp. strangulata]|uniref:uncharacterized protein n=1 Tax=Aegilops tauschii subsp. strangulata TaxID=200361 RepID=UPI003CC88D90